MINKKTIWAFFLIIFTPAVFSILDLDGDLYHYYNFTGVKDSVGSIDGTTSGNPSQLTAGCVIDDCYYFDGDDYIHMDGANNIQNSKFSVCAWVNATDDSNFRTIYSQGCSATDNCLFSMRNNNDGDGLNTFYLRDSAGVVKVNEDEVTHITIGGQWAHVCYVDNAGSYTIYVNGTNSTSGTYSGGSWAFNQVTVGALRFIVPAHFMVGAIDEFGMWANKTLNASEVDALYNDGDGCNPVNNPTGCDAAPPAATPGVVDIPPMTFDLSTNLTNGNYTNNPIRWSLNGTYNYNYSIPDFFSYWSMDQNSNNNHTGFYKINNATIVNATYTSDGNFNGAYLFDGPDSSSYFNITDYDYYSNDRKQVSVFAWANTTDTDTQVIMAQYDTGVSQQAFYMAVTSNVLQVRICNVADCTTDKIYDGTTTITDGAFHHVGFTFNNNDFRVYVDGVEESTTSANDSMTTIVNVSQELLIGAYENSGPSLFFNGTIDEVRIYNRSLTSTEVAEMYATNYPQFDCTLYLNATANETITNQNITTTQTITWDTTNVQATYISNITCDDNFLTASNQVNIVQVDTVPPNLSITPIFQNNTLYYRRMDNITFSIYGEDANLYAGNVTLFRLNPDGSRNKSLNSTQIENINETIYSINYTKQDNTSIDFTTSQLVGNFTNGRYEIFTAWWDSHTNNNPRPPKWYTSPDVVHIDGAMQITGDIKEELTTFVLDGDKYKFKITWETNDYNHSFYLSTNESVLHYRPPEIDGYLGHFVHFPTKRWWDFESPTIESVEVTEISPNNYYIEVFHSDLTDEIEFDSIGDLNNITSSFYFNITDPFNFTASDAITSNAVNNFTILIYNNSALIRNQSTLDGVVYVNITESSYITNITSGGYNMNYTNITYTSGGQKEWVIFRSNSLYLFFFDEGTDLLINTTNVTVEILGPNSSQTQSTDTGSLFVANFAVGDYELRYNAPGYQQNAYFTTVSTSSTQRLDLYLVDNTTSALIVFTLLDEKNNPVFNSTLNRYRFMINDNAWLVVGQSRTDANGETGQYLVPNDVFYQFVVERSGVTLFRGSQQQIYSSSVFLRVPLLADALQSYRVVRDTITTNISYDNATNIVSFFWNDASSLILYGCLEVTESGLRQDTVTRQCTTANSATIEINLSATIKNDTLYTARGFIETNTTGSIYYEEFLEFIINKPFERFGNYGLFLSYFFIMVMFFVGLPFSFPIAVIYSSISMLSLNLLGLTFIGQTAIVLITIIGLVTAWVNKQ